MDAEILQGGERLRMRVELRWVEDLLREAASGHWSAPSGAAPDIDVLVERSGAPFDIQHWEPVTRGAWRHDGRVVLTNACGSGFDVLLEPADDDPGSLRMTARWRPPGRERLAAFALRSRLHLLVRAVLLQYPALWQAGRRGRTPLHASGLAVDGQSLLLAGPGGVGRTTTVLAAIERGGIACSDNLVVADAARLYGVVEPVRVEGGGGRRMAHGRAERTLVGGVPELAPERIVVLRRSTADRPQARPLDPEAAARVLVAGTYAAGELRRYWAFAATLAMGAGLGPAHPPLAGVAAALTEGLPAVEIILGRKRSGDPLALLADVSPIGGSAS